jgi:uncharacterized peroxidase-related enzyme
MLLKTYDASVEAYMQTVEQKPIYLQDVQNNPQLGHYLDLIRSAQSAGRETWNIWYLFALIRHFGRRYRAFRPEATVHLARFTEEIMRGPSPLSTSLRELIAAFTSYNNECAFCTKAHVAVAAALLGSEDMVWNVLRDMETSSLKEAEKVLFRFVRKITKQLPEIDEEHIQIVRAAGWSDEAIYYAISVCALFNFYNRWISATGVHPVSEECHRSRGRVVAEKGYAPRS